MILRYRDYEWKEETNTDCILNAGEYGIEKTNDDTDNRYKIGDGHTVWKDLPYLEFKNGNKFTLQPRRGSEEAFKNNFTVPKVGEMVLIKPNHPGDIYKIRIGDGITPCIMLQDLNLSKDDVLRIIMDREERNCDSLKELVLKEDLKRSKIVTFKEKVKIAALFVCMICFLFLAYLGAMQAPKDINGHFINEYVEEEIIDEDN